MPIMKKLITIAIIFLFVGNSSLSAQENLRSGFIVTLSGDTVHGFIDFKDWTMNPSKVHFKKTENEEGQYYDPYDIRLFAMDSDIYEGGFVDVELSSRESGNYSNNPNLFLEKQLVFLQQLIKGSKPLYVNGNSVYDQYYIKTDSAFELLAYKIYLKEIKTDYGQKDVVIENNRFIGQLAIYLADCHNIGPALAKSKYNEESLKKVFKKYYVCKNENYKVLEPKRNLSIKFGLCYGVSFTGVDFEVYNFEKAERTNYRVMPFGLSLELGRTVSHPEWSIYNEFTYNGPFFLSDKVIEERPSYYMVETTSFEFYSLKLLNLLRYKFKPQNKFVYFANIGLATEIYKGYWSRTHDGIILNEDFYGSSGYNKKFRLNRLVAGVGVNYRHFSLGGRFETGNHLNKLSPGASVMLNYTF
jgi:hypothetical protein